MSRLLTLLFLAAMFIDCSDEDQLDSPPCVTPATVVDITGLDGCSGFVFELEDGTKLRPIITFRCGTPPVPENLPPDPMDDFEFVAGKKVHINYTAAKNYPDVCMAAQNVYITCISEDEPSENE